MALTNGPIECHDNLTGSSIGDAQAMPGEVISLALSQSGTAGCALIEGGTLSCWGTTREDIFDELWTVDFPRTLGTYPDAHKVVPGLPQTPVGSQYSSGFCVMDINDDVIDCVGYWDHTEYNGSTAVQTGRLMRWFHWMDFDWVSEFDSAESKYENGLVIGALLILRKL